ncbi:MAG: hypothetical protein U0359_04900 [Byssovorax sp.]
MRVNPWKVSTVVFAGALAFVVGGSMIKNADAEPQPHMVAALETLKVAHNQLDKATADKGGHRVKAMALVKDAIEEVKAGIDFDNKH